MVAQPLSYIFSSFLSKKHSFKIIVYVHDVPVCMHGVCVEMHASREHRQGSKDNLVESVLSLHCGVDSKACLNSSCRVSAFICGEILLLPCFTFRFETGSHSVAQADLDLTAYSLPGSWDFGYTPSSLAIVLL